MLSARYFLQGIVDYSVFSTGVAQYGGIGACVCGVRPARTAICSRFIVPASRLDELAGARMGYPTSPAIRGL